MQKSRIYVDVDSMNYWWGIYGMARKVGWEDITIFTRYGEEFNKVARTCICSRAYLENGLEDLEQDHDEKDFVDEIRNYLKKNEIVYHYSYDNPKSEDFYEVSFEAERNDIGVKPSYIEVWHPNDRIDESVVKECAIDFCNKFLGIDVSEVIFKEIISIDNAIEEYIENQKLFNGEIKMEFSDELIKQLEEEWNKPADKVLEILNRSVKYDA